MSLSESFQVAALIEKLPKGWKEFKNYLKHKRKEISMDEYIVHLRIEEDNRNIEKRAGKHPKSLWQMWWNKLQKPRNKSLLEKVHHKTLKGGKIKSISLMANVTSVTKRDIGPKIAVAKAKAKEEQARSLLKPI